jgi:hypothetical protein
MPFKFSFTRTQVDEPSAAAVRQCIDDGMRDMTKKLRALKRSAPFSISLDAEIDVTGNAIKQTNKARR